MRILINAQPLMSFHTGVARYTRSIIDALQLYAPQHEYFYSWAFHISKTLPQIPSKSTVSFLFHHLKEIIKKTPLAPVARRLRQRSSGLKTGPFDIYLEPNFIPLKNIKAKKLLVVVHDFSPYIHPEWHPEERVSYFKKTFWTEIKRADLVLVDSHAVKEEAKYLGFAEEKLKVIYPGIDHRLFRPLPKEELESFKVRFNLPDRFLLFVGTLEPRKNLKTFLLAHALLPASLRERYPVILCGYSGWKNEDIKQMMGGTNVKYIGYVSDKELAALYNLATLFVFPSLYEGFGFPPIEAMACGCPVLASDIPVFRETLKDLAFFADPKSPESFAQSLKYLLNNPEGLSCNTLAGIERAREFTWESAAINLLDLIN